MLKALDFPAQTQHCLTPHQRCCVSDFINVLWYLFCSPGSDYYVPGNNLSPIYPQQAYAPLAQQCPISGGANMTTLGRRATSNRACGELQIHYRNRPTATAAVP